MNPTITAFERSPDRGRGLARDMRVRWALEEVGQSYDVRHLSFAAMKEPAHLALHPFGHIPTYEDGGLALFETGAIVFHIAQQHAGLLPRDANARARAMPDPEGRRLTTKARSLPPSPKTNQSLSALVARGVAAEFLPRIGAMYAAKGVEMRCCPEARAILASVAGANLQDASEQDWFEEYLAPIISIKVVDGVDAAIAHINHYSSHHTDAILTRDHMHAQRFLREVDSASVMVNTSTRFADGFEYGLGAEIGISTDKFHARGPVGIEGLTSLKYVVLGQGEVRG
jgi:hypothetical protein